MKILSPVKIPLAIALLMMVSACSEKPEIIKPDAQTELNQLWQEHHQRLKTIKSWQLTGRIAIKTQDDGWTASLKWTQTGQSTRLRIIAPFHGTYEIKQTAGKFSLLTPENELLLAENAESVMLSNLGWSVPVEALKQWIIGLPSESLPIQKKQLNQRAELAQLQQADWNVRLSLYKNHKQHTLPGKLVLTNGNAKITILATEWSDVL